MHDPLTWAFPIGRAFGITIRVHALFPIVAIALILRQAYNSTIPGTWIDATLLSLLGFFIILLHEFGHCFGARRVDGDATEILMWPLGGLAYTEVPRTPWANFITTAAGPAVNVVICLITLPLFLWMSDLELRPPWNPFSPGDTGFPYRIRADGNVLLYGWSGAPVVVHSAVVILLGRIFWLSWLLFLFNMVIVGFPMDAGRLFQCALWPRFGYHQATMAAVYAGFISATILGIVGLVANEVMLLALALFIYQMCKMQWFELIQAEEGMFGYDFSQGYTSLERETQQPQARRKKPNFIQRWLQQRAAKKQKREQDQREYDERRMDELLQKVHDHGLTALTPDERRFMTQFSGRNKNRP